MKQLPIAVALPVTGDKISDRTIERQIARVGASRARYIEFRLDYATNPAGLDLDYLVLEATKVKLETIMTCRLASEGGFYDPYVKGTHETIVKKMIDSRPDFIDVELSTDMISLNKISSLCNEHFIKMILSYHDFTSTPSIKEAYALLAGFIEKAARLGIENKDDLVLKLVFNATTSKDNLLPFYVIDFLDVNDINAISFCMGETGILSRVMSVARRTQERKSGFLTYASLETQTAPGQLNVDDLVDLLEYFS